MRPSVAAPSLASPVPLGRGYTETLPTAASFMASWKLTPHVFTNELQFKCE